MRMLDDFALGEQCEEFYNEEQYDKEIQAYEALKTQAVTVVQDFGLIHHILKRGYIEGTKQWA